MKEPCSPGCPGFLLASPDLRGREFQRCDECHQDTMIDDEDVVCLIEVILNSLPGILLGDTEDIAQARRAAGLLGWDLDRPIQQKRTFTTCSECGSLIWNGFCEECAVSAVPESSGGS